MTRSEMNGRVVAVKLAGVSSGDVIQKDKLEQILAEPFNDAAAKAKVEDAPPITNNLGITAANIDKYWSDLFTKYACPCGKKFGQKLSMLQHVQSIAHQNKTYL